MHTEVTQKKNRNELKHIDRKNQQNTKEENKTGKDKEP